MLHQRSTVIIGAGFCWLFLLLGWAGLLLSTTKTSMAAVVAVTLEEMTGLRTLLINLIPDGSQLRWSILGTSLFMLSGSWVGYKLT
jgi:hypothetical protein